MPEKWEWLHLQNPSNTGTETKDGKCGEIMTSNPNITGIREIRSDTERISASYDLNEMELLE